MLVRLSLTQTGSRRSVRQDILEEARHRHLVFLIGDALETILELLGQAGVCYKVRDVTLCRRAG
ncbi:MAG: hypothetical protein DMG30_23200 [Acidobacteria bacterium]|nr:MAG: hypothetical protein DMG30_23200 [Acidobacteriota bacterium]